MEFECKHCNTFISIDPEQMSTDVRCPACGDHLNLPELPPELVEALEKKLAEENKIKSSDEGDHEAAEAMLEEPASKETTMWREKLAASFQAANTSNITNSGEAQYDSTINRPPLEVAIDSLLDQISIKKISAFDRYYKKLSNIGGMSILVFGLLTLIQCIILTSHNGDALYLIFGIIGLVLSFGFYYLASKFSTTGLVLIRRTELVFYTRDMHHAFGLITLAATLVLLIFGAYTGISEMNFFHAIVYIVPSIATAHASILFLSPAILNTSIAKQATTLGETGLSLIGFIIRVGILLSGIFLAAIPVLCIGIVYIIADTLGNSNPRIMELTVMCQTVSIIAISPLVIYLIYLLYRIFLDFYKSVFQISSNLSIFLESLHSPDE